MIITIGKNNAKAETSVFEIKIILSKRRSISFAINRPIGYRKCLEMLKEKMG